MIGWREAPAAGLVIVVSPRGSDLAALAAEIGVEEVISLEASLLIRRWLDGMELTGELRAVVTRICGISLDAFDETIDEPLLLRFVPAGSPHAAAAQAREIIVDPGEPDPPEPVAGDGVDLAAVLTEQLALALDPFPRKPGARFEAPGTEKEFSPFAALARLKDDLTKS
jgi:hypothetical protein